MVTTRVLRGALIGLAMAIVAGGVLAAQSKATKPAVSGSSDQLVAEVRGLRAEIQQAAAASLRAQILVGRLQLEEQRINVMTSQLNEVRRARVAQEAVLTKATEAAKNLVREQDRARARAELESAQREADRLRTEEATLLEQVKTEQRRWLDFSARLDELERVAPTGRK
jgi:hypothetical protein